MNDSKVSTKDKLLKTIRTFLKHYLKDKILNKYRSSPIRDSVITLTQTDVICAQLTSGHAQSAKIHLFLIQEKYTYGMLKTILKLNS